MGTARLRFYEELNDFLPPSERGKTVSCNFTGTPSVKDIVESIGVPHVEIDLILVNGQSVDFKCKLTDGDEVSVYPVFESFNIATVTRLREVPLRDLKFILDVHLGKLSKYLRLLGFDTSYNSGYDDNTIIRISVLDKRIILTHDRGLLKNSRVSRGYWVRSMDLEEQAKEIIRKFDLKSSMKPFTRCLECNGMLVDVEKEEVIKHLLPKTKTYFNKFRKCFDCGRIYWEGSHYESMTKFINKIISPDSTSF
jgi:uncharacterized protein with PIN domain